MKVLIALTCLFSLPLMADISCDDLTTEEITNLYCDYKLEENFQERIQALKSECEKESDIYERVSQDIKNEARHLYQEGGDGLTLQLLSSTYMLRSSGAFSVINHLSMLELKDSMERLTDKGACR